MEKRADPAGPVSDALRGNAPARRARPEGRGERGRRSGVSPAPPLPSMPDVHAHEPESRPLVTHGNRLRLLPSGDETFRALLADIDAARTRVWLETYIFVPDAAGQQVLDALVRAARRGCDVILMVDRFGAHKLRDRHVQPLRDAGGHAFWFNPLFGLGREAKKVTPFGFHRDHRKILVVDDAVAYTGGRNVSMEWVGSGPGCR